MMEDAETFYLREYAKVYRRSAEEEFRSLIYTYREVIMREPYKDCSAWAEYVIWELHLMQRKEARSWGARTQRDRHRLMMALRWLRRRGVTNIDYDAVMPTMWEDIAVLIFLSSNYGLQRAYPTLTLEALMF